MDNTIIHVNRGNQRRNTKICSINIGCLSNKARFKLDKYVNDENFGIIALQEN